MFSLQVGMNIIGLYDISLGKLAMGRDILTNDFEFNLEQRPFIAGNVEYENLIVSGEIKACHDAL